MEEKISSIIIEHLGLSVFIICALIVGIIFLSIWCYKVYVNVKGIKDLPCNKHSDKMAEHDNAVIRIETSISYLTKEIDSALRLFQNGFSKNDVFTKTNSPLSITEKGWEMIHRLDLDKIFDKNWNRIDKIITDGVGTDSAYDIDRFCIEQAIVFPEKFLSEADILKLKEDAFQNGLTITSYMKVIAVLSRDRYFKEHNIKSVE